MLTADFLSWSRHRSGAGPWHRSDPRARLLASLLLSVMALASRTIPQFTVVFALLLLLYVLAGTGWKRALAGLRPFAVLMLLTAALQLLLTPGGLPSSATGAAGLRLALTVLARLAAVILVSVNLLATTSPLDLSRSLAWLFLPARRIGLPVDGLLLQLHLSLQLLPLLFEESRSARLGLESRGISLRHPRPAMRLRALGAWVLTVLTAVMERARRLTVALETKGFTGAVARRPRFAPSPRGPNWLILAGGAAGGLAWLAAFLLRPPFPFLLP